ncbi:MAG TPA: hypothetical protein VMB52_03555 [Verrucomicrobiae bacterium]|nr:hypothetical protein [Verrucomicrobiae bacterium]
MRNIKSKLLKRAKGVKHIVKPLSISERFLHENVPYFCQWESRELAKQLLAKEVTTDDDPRWKSSGAKTKAEYREWSWSGCGMACTKMLMAYTTGKVIPLIELGKNVQNTVATLCRSRTQSGYSISHTLLLLLENSDGGLT